MKPKTFFKILFLFCLFVSPAFASASSTLSLTPASGSYKIGSNFSVAVTVNTDGASINAIEAGMTFDKDKVSISSIDTSESILKIWVEYPSYSNSTGVIRFAGGVPSPGFSGNSTVFTINFKANVLGTATVSFDADPKILLNDGSGTNSAGTATGGTYEVVPSPASVTCSASPSSANPGASVAFSAAASGGIGSYVYAWSGACTGSSSTCTETFTTIGTKTATVKITSGAQTASADCSSSIVPPGLSVTCSASKDSLSSDEEVTFTASATGGSEGYAYSWSNGCVGTSSNCKTTYTTAGLKKTTVTVTSGGQTASADCTVSVSAACAPPTTITTTTGPTGVISVHNVCSKDSKCIVAFGEGESQCKTDEDCQTQQAETPVVTETVVEVLETPVETIQETAQAIQETAQTIKETVNTPEASVATKAVSTTGAVVATAGAFSILALSPFEFGLIFFRLLGILFTGLGLKKRAKSWGVVYDSVTKQPLDPAYVILKDSKGKTVASAITDLDGRYGFLVEPGIYQLSAAKTNYVFPSSKLFGKVNDEFYKDLYFGGAVQIKEKGEVIMRNIPLDPTKFDWNEFVKRDRKLMKFYSRFDGALRKIYDFSFIIGIIVALVAYFAAPYPYNLVILMIYLLLLFLRVTSIKLKVYGKVVQGESGDPLSFAVLRIISPVNNIEIAHKVTDKYGKYYCLVPPGKYYVNIEKKNDDGSYSLVYTSSPIDASKKGIIKNKFII